MLSNQDNTQMPGSMPGSMPGAIPENNNTAHNALNQDAKPSIGGSHKIQSGILHHGLPVDNNDNVHNNTHGEHNFSKDKSLVNNAASGMTGHQNNMNPLHSNHGENNVGNNIDNHYNRDADEMKNHHDQQFGFDNHRAGNNPIQSDLGHNNHEGVNNNPLQSGLGHNNHEGVNNNPLQSGNDKLHHSSNNDDHHYKRDVAAGVGAAGLAGHELKNHHDQQFGFDNHRAGNNPIQSDLGHNNHEGVNNNPLQSGLGHNNHEGVNNNLLQSGLGHNNHEGVNNNPLQSGLGHNNHEGVNNNPLQSGNDKLHHSSNNDDHHYKRDVAAGVGAAGLAGHELKNHHDQQFGFDNHRAGNNPIQSGLGHNNHEGVNNNPLQSGLGHNNHEGVNNNPLQSGNDKLHHSSNNDDHHYKRDVAAGVGAAGLAGHELKNHHDQQSGLDSHRAGNNPIQSGLGHNNHEGVNNNPLQSGNDKLHHSSNNDDHHYKRDVAAGVGAAGAAGVAGHEMKEHHDNKEAASNRTSVSSASSGEKKGAAVHDKPLNTGGDAHHVAEQPPMGLGGLTGKQPVGEINFHKLS